MGEFNSENTIFTLSIGTDKPGEIVDQDYMVLNIGCKMDLFRGPNKLG